jgi:hypothetical protein
MVSMEKGGYRPVVADRWLDLFGDQFRAGPPLAGTVWLGPVADGIPAAATGAAQIGVLGDMAVWALRGINRE